MDHARNPVQLANVAREIKNEPSFDIILDIGPQPMLWSVLKTYELPDKLVLSSSAKRGKDQNRALLDALGILFENNIAPNFLELFGESHILYSKASLPTYPFQRQRHYPSCIASRSSGSLVKAELRSAPQPDVLSLDRALYDVVTDHCIDGQPVLPGAALVNFVTCHSPPHSVKVLYFHKPLALESKDSNVSFNFDDSASFALHYEGSRVCSGVLGRSNIAIPLVLDSINSAPSRIVHCEQVYEAFTRIYFGPRFRNIQEFRLWPDRADALITVVPTVNPDHDQIRALDACLHMFGAVAKFGNIPVPQEKHLPGTFLPTSLEDYCVYVEMFPPSFICRYRLPVEGSRNFHLMSTAFEIISHSGQVLASCRKYSVAWVPMGVALQSSAPPRSTVWLENSWIEQDLRDVRSASTRPDKVVFLGLKINLEVLRILTRTGSSDSMFIDLSVAELKVTAIDPSSYAPSSITVEQMLSNLAGTSVTFVLDVTPSNVSPHSDEFSQLWRHILRIMQSLVHSKVIISNFVVISTMSAPVVFGKGESLPKSRTPTLGAVVQGMLRVFRRETGLADIIWCLDLPDRASESVAEILNNELWARQRGGPKHSIVTYRFVEGGERFVRLVPVLLPMDYEVIPAVLNGITVIVGMGSIGCALAAHINGSPSPSTVVFVGRRPVEDKTVRSSIVLPMADLTS